MISSIYLTCFQIIDTAYAQNTEDQCWYDFDDSHVRKVAEKDIKVKNKSVKGAICFV
jgi:hypothetical protein